MKQSSIISAGNKNTTEAAAEIINSGGNAFDATIAGIFMAMVSEPGLTSAGGGGFLLAYPENRIPIMYDFFVNMPSYGDNISDFISIDVDFGDTKQEFYIGNSAIAVPGNIAGLFHVHDKLGRMPIKEILYPAINAAKNGVIIDKFQSYCIKILEPIITYSDYGKQIFMEEDSLLNEGKILKMPEFSDFLEILSIEGIDLFYKGEISTLIQKLNNNGGLIGKKDLEQYNVIEREPIATNFKNYTVLTNPPPAISGLLIDFILQLINSKNGSNKINLSELVCAFDITNNARKKYLQKMCNNMNIDTSNILDKYKEVYHNKIHSNENFHFNENRYGSTTHISVIDKDGNAASATTTNGEGCGHFISEAGFMLNNMLGEQDLNPEGFHKHIPGTRIPSMVAPTIVIKDGKPILITGSAGSNRIASVIIQIIVKTLYNNIDIESATNEGRIYLDGNIIHAEPDVLDSELDHLSSSYTIQKWEDKNIFFGGANSILMNKGVGDPRRSGYSITI